jgi:hypothetical protein
MVEPVKLGISYSGNQTLDFKNNVDVSIDPYISFFHAMKSPLQRKNIVDVLKCSLTL